MSAYDEQCGNNDWVKETSEGFSDMCVWMWREGSEEARVPREVRRAGVQEIAKRGVRIGFTRVGEPDEAGRERMWVIKVSVSAMEVSVDGSM